MKYLSGLAFVFLSFCCAHKEDTTNYPVKIDTTKTHFNNNIPFKNYLGINLFEWDYVEQPNQQATISERKIKQIKAFGGIRHYLDWERIESKQGLYNFNPSHAGGWFFDEMYKRTKAEGMDILVCLKTIPPWLIQTYPESMRDYENVPALYGSDKSSPSSYLLQAKAAFQFAARYGSTKVNATLLKVDATKRWVGDVANTAKTGLNLVKYIECDNERDKWWKGKQAEQSPEEYAANLSAFYDGHKGKLGKDVGVKNADPNMQVVMSGLAVPKTEFVIKMIEWCKKNRGFKKDGKVDLCFDVINYHIYPNAGNVSADGKATNGIAPELSNIGKVADEFLAMAKNYLPNMEVWMTETGYDVSASTNQAKPIGAKTAYVTQADWNLRTALLYARHRINRSMFFMLDDVNLNDLTQYSSSGFWNADFTARPALNFIRQAKNLLGDYIYLKTISNDPIVDVYKKEEKEIYVLVIPDQRGRTAKHTLDLGSAKKAIIHNLQAEKETTNSKTVSTSNGKLEITVTETPIFVEKL